MLNRAAQLNHVSPVALNTVHTHLRPIPLWLGRSHLAGVRSKQQGVNNNQRHQEDELESRGAQTTVFAKEGFLGRAFF